MNIFQKIYRLSALLLCGFLTLGGCGRDGSDSNSDRTPASGSNAAGNNAVSDTQQRMAYKETRYLPEFTDTSGIYGANSSKSLGFANNTFYLINGTRSGYGYYIKNCKLTAYRPDTGEETILLENTDEDTDMLAGAPLKDGSVIVLFKTGRESKDPGYRLCKVNSEGTELFSTDYPDLSLSDGSETGSDRDAVLTADGQGRCYLLTRAELLLFDEKGRLTGKIDLSGKSIRKIICSDDGKIYAYEQFTRQLIPVDFETSSLSASPFSLPVDVYAIGTSETADILLCSSSTVYQYNCADSGLTPLFDLQDSQILSASQVNTIGELKDGRIFLFSVDEFHETTETAFLTPTPLDKCPVKEVITIGTVGAGAKLLEDTAYFNRQNHDFTVSILDYRVGGRSYDDAMTALKLDISTGKGPDICELYSLQDESLLSGGFFTDLSDYLDESTQFRREDFIGRTLEIYSRQDQLLAIPNYFWLRTITGSSDVVGEMPGWDLEDVKAVIAAHPDALLFSTQPASYMFDICIRNLLDKFVDFDRRKADFDSQEYIDFLNFINGLPDNFTEKEQNECWTYGKQWLQDGRALFSCEGIWRLNELQELDFIFNGKYTCIGYPSPKKTPDCVIYGMEAYAVSAFSPHKELAWEFIEWGLSTQGEEEQFLLRMGFPTRTDVFERELQEAMSKGEGRDYAGARGSAIWGDGTTVVFRETTAAEAELIHALIEIASPEKGEEQIIVEIMKEEAASLSGSGKSAEEVARVTQNRVQLYLDE